MKRVSGSEGSTLALHCNTHTLTSGLRSGPKASLFGACMGHQPSEVRVTTVAASIRAPLATALATPPGPRFGTRDVPCLERFFVTSGTSQRQRAHGSNKTILELDAPGRGIGGDCRRLLIVEHGEEPVQQTQRHARLAWLEGQERIPSPRIQYRTFQLRPRGPKHLCSGSLFRRRTPKAAWPRRRAAHGLLVRT